jgi:DNA polymerase-4
VSERCILHVDMDAFYASVEQRDNPELRGKPLVVGGTSNRGVVAAASYAARTFGVRSAMPMREALRRCPELISVKPRMGVYRDVSAEVFRIFRSMSPLVEGLSLDEAFIDVSESRRLLGDGPSIAADIKQQIQTTLGLTASVGVAPNKLVAKIASDLDKPDGLVVVSASAVTATLDPLPVSVIPGIGREMNARLLRVGIRTIFDLRSADDALLRPLFGRYTDRMRARASGIDDRPVVPERDDKSISAEETFDSNLSELKDLERHLSRLTERVVTRIRKAALAAGTVHIKIREADFTTYTRQKRMVPPTDNTLVIYRAACELLKRWLSEHPGASIRLLGVGGSNLQQAMQDDLFAAQPTADSGRIDATVDQIREKFGDLALGRARSLKRD